MAKSRQSTHPDPIPLNPALVWDYEIPAEENQTEAFQRWYLARVLTRGSSDDLREVGLATIYSSLPDLNLPIAIRQFWEWYFNLPDVKARHEPADLSSKTDHRSNP